MPGPWEKYAQPAPQGGGKPWEKYGRPVEAAAKPEQENTWGNAIKNVGEAGLSLASGIGAGIAGGAAGLAAIPVDAVGQLFGRDAGETADPSRVRDRVSDALTYHPENPDSLSSKIVQAPGRVMGAAKDFLSETTDKATGGVPYVGNLVGAIPEVAANVLGLKGARAAVTKAAEKTIPTTEGLHNAAREAYKRAEGSGAVIGADTFSATIDKVQKNAQQLGLDKDLTPKSTRVLARLEESRGKPLDFMEAEQLRRVASGVAQDVHPGTFAKTHDAAVAQRIVDDLDDTFDALPEGGKARAEWARYRRSEMMDEMQRKAEIRAGANFTQSGLEHALRNEFRSLATNTKKMKRFTPDQRSAIERVAKGTAGENAMRLVGKLAPTGVVSAAGGAGLGAMLGGGIGAFMAPVVGTGARALATRATLKNARRAREAIVGRGLPGEAAPDVRGLTGARAALLSQIAQPDQDSE